MPGVTLLTRVTSTCSTVTGRGGGKRRAACRGTFSPTPGVKDRTLDGSGISAEGTSLSAPAVAAYPLREMGQSGAKSSTETGEKKLVIDSIKSGQRSGTDFFLRPQRSKHTKGSNTQKHEKNVDLFGTISLHTSNEQMCKVHKKNENKEDSRNHWPVCVFFLFAMEGFRSLFRRKSLLEVCDGATGLRDGILSHLRNEIRWTSYLFSDRQLVSGTRQGQTIHTNTTKARGGQTTNRRECKHNNTNSRYTGLITSCALSVTRTKLALVYNSLLLFHTHTHLQTSASLLIHTSRPGLRAI